MSAYHDFDHVDTFTTGAIGRPGARTFYLQARLGRQRVTVKCEKQQVGAMVQYLRTVLSDLPPAEDTALPGSLELVEPVDEVFVLGPIGLGYDRQADRVVVQLEEMTFDDDDAADGHIRLHVTRSQAASFCDHAERVIASGRPDCRWCNSPIDPDGHACPRMN
jgi:uncharacterized repeat protein (TIGR03847 family)